MPRLQLLSRTSRGFTTGVLAFAAIASGSCRGAATQSIHPFRGAFAVDTVAATVTIPLHSGRVGRRTVWYVITESSDRNDAKRRGVPWAPRLTDLAGTLAVQDGREDPRGGIAFTAGVDFTPEWSVVRAAAGDRNPVDAEPGSVAEPGYSPFVQLAGGVIVNAPIIADSRQLHDRVVRLDIARGVAVLRLTRAPNQGRPLWYLSTDASDHAVAAYEKATWVPTLSDAPVVVDALTRQLALGTVDATQAASLTGKRPTGMILNARVMAATALGTSP